MLIKIGSPEESSGITDLLLACHQRIRFFMDLAKRLADAQGASEGEIQDAAGRVVRYFSESLPLHVADEEESITPRLSGKDAGLDETLQTMHREHRRHEPRIELLLNTCRELQSSPRRLDELREALGAAASTLAHDFTAHLEREEKIVIPAIRSYLSETEQATMAAELRARRSH